MKRILILFMTLSSILSFQAKGKKYEAKYKYLCKCLTEEHLEKIQKPKRNTEVNSPAEVAFSDLAYNIGQMFKNVNDEETVRNYLSNIIANAIYMVSDAKENGIHISKSRCKELIEKLDYETRQELNKFIDYQQKIVKKLEPTLNDQKACTGPACSDNEKETTAPEEKKRKLDCDETGCYIK